MNQGFALILALLLLLFLTLFGFAFLLIAGSYYSSSKNVFENENARLACEQACRMMVDRHNLAAPEPRFFFDPSLWIENKMVPLDWNGYEIKSELKDPWNASAKNHMTLAARRGRYESVQQIDVRQIRPEDFALYAESAISLNQDSLFHGRVLLRNGMEATVPVTRFRRLVHGNVFPEQNVSFRVRSEQVLNFPPVNDFLSRDHFYEETERSGYLISGGDPAFWNASVSRYELDLDRLEILKENPSGWRVRYNGADVAIIAGLHLWFDNNLAIRQGYRSLSTFDNKISEPLYIGSAGNIHLQSSIQPVESSTSRHPLCIAASEAIYVSPALLATRLSAFLISFGSEEVLGVESGFIIESGGAIMTEDEKETFKNEVNASVFLVENEKHQALLDSLEANEKIVWVRGSLFLQNSISAAADLSQLHFESSSSKYLFLPSFPFVQVVEGSVVWQ